MDGQSVDQVTAKVLSGDWSPGQPIPSIRQLASASKVSVITVKRAYLELERAGVIVTRPGSSSLNWTPIRPAPACLSAFATASPTTK